MTKVLVADDEQCTRDLLVDTLMEAGYDAIEAEDGGVAFDKACHEQPDIILLDLLMPVMDGFEVMRSLRSLGMENPVASAIPVILVTGLSAEEGEQAAMALGARHYIAKSWDPVTVKAAVRVALREGETGPDEVTGLPASNGPEPRTVVGTQAIQLSRNLAGSPERGALTLVEGDTSSGKSTLCQHLAHRALQEGRGVAYFTCEHTARGLVAQMGSLGLEVSNYISDGDFRICPLQMGSPGEDPEGLMAALALEIERLPSRYSFIIVDSITILASYGQETALTNFAFSCKRLCDDGRSTVLVAHSSAFDEKALNRLRVLCDSHFNLRAEQLGSKRWNLMQVCKVRDAELDGGNLVSFNAVPGLGMRIAPFHKVRV